MNNVYTIIRIDKGVRGVPGATLPVDHEHRIRHYIRAESQEAAEARMLAVYPNEKIAVIHVEHNVSPLSWEKGEKVAA